MKVFPYGIEQYGATSSTATNGRRSVLSGSGYIVVNLLGLTGISASLSMGLGY